MAPTFSMVGVTTLRGTDPIVMGSAVVTNGADAASDATADGLVAERPPEVLVTRVTGAGDTFMAAHIVAELRGAARAEALSLALDAAAAYVSGDIAS